MSMMSSTTDLGGHSIDSARFNKGFILPSLLRQLQSILQQYPDDGQILKELIQNAEDAKAKRIVFMLDNTTYPQQSLHNPELADFQGPALYVYNDAIFETADWDGIRMLNDSVKEKDPMKVGRFGLGFKSVFHMTDLPSIFSGENIAFLDPHELHFRNGRYPTSSYLWNLKSDKQEISDLADQFTPYIQELFGATDKIFENGFFPGTMFRFPFRGTGVTSDLCQTTYNVGKARDLFVSLEAEAHVILLFLKNIEKIEVYEKVESSLPRKVMSLEISPEHKSAVCERRNEFVSMIEKRRSGEVPEAAPMTYLMSTDVATYPATESPDKKTWLVSHYYGSQKDLNTANGLGHSLGLLPWVAVALPVLSDDDSPAYLNQPEGHVFCFLPLPRDNESPTGLRFHVHGYFAVDQNRRHIKKRSAEQYGTNITDTAILWNEYLVGNLLPKALTNAVTFARSLSTSNASTFQMICSSIPERRFVKQEWKPFADTFIRELPKLAVFYSPVRGGTYSAAKDALFDNVEDTNSSTEIIRLLLHRNDTHLVSVPNFLLEQLGSLARQVVASMVCTALKNVESSLTLKDSDRITLLKYLVDKLSSDRDQLIGTKLLPLGDGSWIEFKRPTASNKIFVDSVEHPRSLLPGLGHLFPSDDALETCRALAVTGITQLTILDKSSVAMVMRNSLLSQYTAMQEVDTANLSWYTDQWLIDLWEYLLRFYRLDLTTFEKLHLVPVSQGILSQLSIANPIVVSCHGTAVLDGTLRTVCEIIGIRVVDDLPAAVLNHPACFLGKYLLQPDTQGVMYALSKVSQDNVVSKCATLSDDQRDELRKIIVSGVLSNAGVLKLGERLIRAMPIFRTLEDSGFRKSAFVSLNEVCRAAPLSSIPVEFPEQLLDVSDSLVCAFATNLKIKPMSLTEALISIVFPAVNNGGQYEQSQVIKLFQFVCDKWTECTRENSAFHNNVASVKFIPKSNGDLVTPRELFDSTESTLCQLFVDEDVFPTGVFNDPRYLHILRSLGLKGRNDVTAMDILGIAQKLDTQTRPNVQVAQALLLFLESHVDLLSERVNNDSLISHLRSLKWVLIVESKPSSYPEALTFLGLEADNLTCQCPINVLSMAHSALVGSVKPLVQTNGICKLSTQFGCETEPAIADVVQHLLNVISCFTMQQKADFQVMLKEIYQYLNKHAVKFNTVAHTLHQEEWIFHSNGFAESKRLVVETPFMDLHPYVYVMPDEFKLFTNLWREVGIRHRCDLGEVLGDIAEKHRHCGCAALCSEADDMLMPEISSQCSQMDVKHDLNLCIGILNEVASFPVEERVALRGRLQVPINSPTDTLQLKKIDDCTYCDKEWFQQGLDVHNITDKTISLVHPHISLSTAEALNIHTVCSRIMEAEELSFGDAYGQSEPLTRRLKNILQDYTDGLAVLKELIQNADDAGASEVKFLYDERSNDDAQTTLIDQGMKAVQGPAFWVYNDAMFTSEDFENLVKLSGATKELCKDKIGRFGLGFNAVYNLTDVPSLVSANHVVFLDPHATHLKRAIRDKGKPGIKLDMRTSSKTFDLFPDQFKPYNGVFDCNFITKPNMTSYPGTLFRFPLRSEQQSKLSEISSKHYSSDEVHSLLDLLAKCADHLLLFTQSVEKITLFHLSAKSASPQMMQQTLVIRKHVERILRPLTEGHPYAVLKAANSLYAKRMNESDIPKIESSMVLKVESQHSNNNSETNVSYWLVTASMGKGESNKMALKEKDLISVGGVAAQLVRAEVDGVFGAVSLAAGTTSADNGGKVFCFLPLPIRSFLPVHINGFFAVTSSRMHLFEENVSDKTDKRAVWNKLLMEDAVKDAYIIMLEDIVKLGSDAGSYSVWPVHRGSPDAGLFSRLIDNLYRNICDERGPNVFTSNGQAVSFNQCRFLDDQYRRSEIGSATLTVFRQVKTNDFEVIDLPSDLLSTIMMTSAAHRLVARSVKKPEFLRDWFLPNINKSSVDLRDKVTIDALLDNEVYNLLRDYQCIPVKPNNSLKQPKTLVHPMSTLALLYDEDEECFPMLELSAETLPLVYQKLIKLGMKHHELTWQEVADRCDRVPQKPVVSSNRLNILVQLMTQKTALGVSSDEKIQIERIKRIKFLPVKKKPSSFPVPWYGDECDGFTSCDKAYLSKVQELVCCTFPVIDDSVIFSVGDSQLKQLLELSNKPIAAETVFYQLDSVLALADQSGKLNITESNKLDKVLKISDDVYSFLDKCLAKGTLNETFISAEMNAKKSILLRNVGLFMLPRCCAKIISTASEALLPYLCALPLTFQSSYKSLLSSLTIQENFSAQDFVKVLGDLKFRYGSNPLPPTDLKVALNIVNDCLSACPCLPEGLEVFVPNTDGVLHSVTSLCFCSDPLVVIKDTQFCHPQISWKAANKLGVKSVNHAFFDQHAIGLPFGQSEKLVKRLQRILSGYPFDKAVLKEMLQNADDAGATEVHFILDRRQLPTEQIFDDKWKPLQGPALCIYNNKPFTESDITGIQNLGEGNKGSDPTKTGQFGVGFNCVYHVTDVPTLLTHVDGEEVICIFDPHCSYVPGATPERPGRRINLDQTFKERFADIFMGYFENDYSSTGGTMFRLPLRNDVMARSSDLSKKPVSVRHIEDLFETFQSDINQSMLFLNSVEEVHLKITSSEGSTRTIFCVKTELGGEAKERRERIKLLVKDTASSLKDGKISLEDVVMSEEIYEVKTIDSKQVTQHWLVAQRFGFDESGVVPQSVSRAYQNGDIGLLPRAGVAYLYDQKYRMKHKSRLFCFLPLPIETSLPVHINGHFALDTESRRNLWRNDVGEYRTDWNTFLMKHIVSPAYCSLIMHLRNKISADTDELFSQYYCIFPCITDVKDGDRYLNEMSISVYQRLASKSMPVLSVYSLDKSQQQWLCPLKHEPNFDGHFDDLSSQLQPVEYSRLYSPYCSMVTKKKDEVVRDILCECGFILFNSPIRIFDNFCKAKVPVRKVSATAVLDFFATFQSRDSLCTVRHTDVPLCDTVFKNMNVLVNVLDYCTQADNYKKKLLGLPLMVTCDNYLRQFDQSSVKFKPQFASVLPNLPELFMKKDVFISLRLDAAKDTYLCRKLSIQDFIDRLPSLLYQPLYCDIHGCIAICDLFRSLEAKKVPKSWLLNIWQFFSSFVSSEKIATILQPIQDWCLLPALCGGKEVLLPIANARCLIPMMGSSLSSGLETCLAKLGIPQPLSKYFIADLSSAMILYNKPTVPTLYTQILGSSEKADSIVMALELLQSRTYLSIGELSHDESLVLLQYMSRTLEQWSKVPNAIETVQKLPVFCTVYSKLVTIFGSRPYVLPNRIPVVDMESWTATRDVIFLRNEHSVRNVLLYLGCKEQTEVEIYCGFIFQHFELLTDKGKLAHLKHVRDYVLPDLHKAVERSGGQTKRANELELNALLESLRTLEFIPDSQHSMTCACDFYDPGVDVFKAMVDKTHFPPKPFDDYEWRQFLRECGMIHTVTQTMFLDYAKQVAEAGLAELSKTVLKMSMTLVSHLFSRDDLFTNSFIQQVKHIAFIVPLSVGSSKEHLHLQHGSRNDENCLQLVPFAGSIVSGYDDCVWTVQSILPDWANPSTYYYQYKLNQRDPWNELHQRKNIQALLFKELLIDDHPQLTKVAHHIEKLCGRLASILTTAYRDGVTLASVMNSIYEFLVEKIPLPEGASSLLAMSPFIYDKNNNLLVRPNQTVVFMSQYKEIRPYLISSPSELNKYCDLFFTLGATKQPTLDQYSDVLRVIHDKSRDSDMFPNELKAVRQTVRAFFTLLDNSQLPIKFSDKDLYLPCRDGKLHESSSIVFDNRNIIDRIVTFDKPVLIDLATCDLRLTFAEIETLISKLPARAQLQLISAVVEEKIKSDCKTVDTCTLANDMEAKLQSGEFQNGLRRLAWHEFTECPADSRIVKAEVERIVENLQNIRIVGVEKLTTVLSFKGSMIEDSETDLDFFSIRDIQSEDKQQVSWTLYMHDRTYRSELFLLYDNVAKLINVVAGRKLGNVLIQISRVLECKTDIDALLDTMRIKPMSSTESKENQLALRVGSFVPVKYHCFLRQDICFFAALEYAALEIDDPALSDMNELVEQCNRDIPTYVLVQIIERLVDDKEQSTEDVSIEARTMYRVKINEREERIVAARSLYAFNRQNIDSPDTDTPSEIALDYFTITRNLKILLRDAWRSSDDDKKTILKRLFLRWSSEKNAQNADLASKVTEFILLACDRLEKGQPIDDEDVLKINTPMYTPTYTHAASSSSPSTGNSLAGSCFRYMQERAKAHRQHQQQFEKTLAESKTDVQRRKTQNFFGSFVTQSNPQPGEGRRWLRQAEVDMMSASNDEGAVGCSAYEWSCFKYYQAAVKALRGVMFARDANRDYDVTGSIHELTRDLRDTTLSDRVQSLINVVGDRNRMQYPSERGATVDIPHDLFTSEKSDSARKLCREVLELCRQRIESQELRF